MQNQKGFTLVELLIVISLIAVLSVGVLATINPVEQRNKAVDANTSNDSGEVLNSLERYYTNQASYPWMVVDNVTYNSADVAYVGASHMVGSGLCTNAILGADKVHTLCSAYNAQGSLIASDELKAAFLEKNYGAVQGDGTSRYNILNKLWIIKQSAAVGNNSIYVCYIPKAKSNRTYANKLKKLGVDDGTFLSSTFVDAIAYGLANADFTGTGDPVAAWTFASPATSLFKCVP